MYTYSQEWGEEQEVEPLLIFHILSGKLQRKKDGK